MGALAVLLCVVLAANGGVGAGVLYRRLSWHRPASIQAAARPGTAPGRGSVVAGSPCQYSEGWPERSLDAQGASRWLRPAGRREVGDAVRE